MDQSPDNQTGPTEREELAYFAETARVPRIRTLLEFAEEEIVIPEGTYRGFRWRGDRQPYAVLLLTAIGSGRWKRRAVLGCVQSGKTLHAFIILLMYYLFELKEKAIAGVPTEEMCSAKWFQELLPVIHQTRYRQYLPTRGAGSLGGYSDEINFTNGAVLKFMTGHGGDEKRSGYTARVVVITEADKMDEAGDASREADPISQLQGRTLSYDDRAEVAMECTVSVKAGRIWKEYQAGTASRIACPCPYCGEFVTPEKEHLVGWNEATSELEAKRSAWFACPACGHRLTEDDRRAMNLAAVLVHRGQSIDKAGVITGEPPDTDTLGFRWNAFNNLFWSVGTIGAKAWSVSQAEDEENAKKEWLQFWWAEPYEPPEFELVELDYEQVRRRFAEPRYTKAVVPDDTEVVVAAIDLHKRYGYWMATAWRPAARSQVIDYGTFEVPSQGMLLDKALLAALAEFRDEILFQGWYSPGGKLWRPRITAVDAGWMPGPVYEFARDTASQQRFLPAIGRGESQHDKRYRSYSHPDKTNAQIKAIGEQYYIAWASAERSWRAEVNADFWKLSLRDRLRTPQGEPGAMELYYSTDPKEHTTFTKHLAAEEPKEEFVPGRGNVTRWVLKSRGNHLGDVAYANCWLAHLCGVRLAKRTKPPEPHAPAAAARAVPTMAMDDGRPFLITER